MSLCDSVFCEIGASGSLTAEIITRSSFRAESAREVVSRLVFWAVSGVVAASVMRIDVARANVVTRLQREGVATPFISLTPYAGTNRIRFYGTLSACALRGQAPRSMDQFIERCATAPRSWAVTQRRFRLPRPGESRATHTTRR